MPRSTLESSAMLRACLTLVLLCFTSAASASEQIQLTVSSSRTMPAPEDKRKLQVVMRFTDESRRDFGDFTARHVNQCARFLVDGNTASGTARILTSITGGYAVLDPILPDQAEQIAQRLSEHPASLAVELAPCQWPAPAPAPGT